MQSKAHATWEGDLLKGSGKTTLASGAAKELAVSWPSRTEAPSGKTSPEELIAAAHASCYCMALSHGLAGEGHPPTKLEADAVATFAKTDAGFRITKMALSVRGQVPGLDEAGFKKAAEAAKEGCPVSQALKGNVEITLEASLA